MQHLTEMDVLGKEARRRGRLVATVAAGALIVAAVPALALPGLPPNDDFGSAAKLSGRQATALGTNVLATKQPGEPAHAGVSGGASVWYSWTPDRSGPAQVNTCSKATTFNTVVAVYTRSGAVPPFSNLTKVAGNDDHPGGACSEDRSLVDFDVKGGTTYYVAVDGVGGAAGALQVNVGEVSDFAGTTSQGQPIRFRLSKDRRRVTHLNVRMTATCLLSGTALSTSDTFPLGGPSSLRLRDGGFAKTVSSTQSGVYEKRRVSGKRAGRLFAGVARYHSSSVGGSCDTLPVAWTAHPATLTDLAG